MLEMVDNRTAWHRKATRIPVLANTYTTRFYSKDNDMSIYIDELDTLAAQLEGICPNTYIPAVHNALLLLAPMTK